MGSTTNASGSNAAQLAQRERELADLNRELQLELAQSAIDIAGIADPTPVSDVIGAGLSLYRGDFVGAGLSLISVVPYVGDALGKTAKGAKLAASIAKLKKRIEGTVAAINKLRNQRKQAAALERARRKEEAARRAAARKTTQPCPGDDFEYGRHGSRIPRKGGKWDGEPGNSKWHPDPNDPKGKEILDATGGKPIQYKDGYPDFSPHATHKVEINMTGNDAVDFKAANEAAGLSRTPKGYTWHHKEDGVTMELVPSALHGNVPHTGGASIVTSPGF